MKEQEEDELAEIGNKIEYPKTHIYKDHFLKGEDEASWKYEELYKKH